MGARAQEALMGFQIVQKEVFSDLVAFLTT
jgi:hypothetical protein